MFWRLHHLKVAVVSGGFHINRRILIKQINVEEYSSRQWTASLLSWGTILKWIHLLFCSTRGRSEHKDKLFILFYHSQTAWQTFSPLVSFKNTCSLWLWQTGNLNRNLSLTPSVSWIIISAAASSDLMFPSQCVGNTMFSSVQHQEDQVGVCCSTKQKKSTKHLQITGLSSGESVSLSMLSMICSHRSGLMKVIHMF